MSTEEQPGPAPHGWLYLLVAVSLASFGVGAGRNFFDSQRSMFALPWQLANVRCVRATGFPIPGPGVAAHLDPATMAAYAACIAPHDRIRGLVMLGGAVLALAAVALLTLLVPQVDRRRLRRHRSRCGWPAARARFADLCEEHGLAGRRRPELFVANPPVRQPFTTVLPGGRAMVVLPVATALAHADRHRFDPIVHHELAHVLARDVRWVSTVRAMTWVTIRCSYSPACPTSWILVYARRRPASPSRPCCW